MAKKIVGVGNGLKVEPITWDVVEDWIKAYPELRGPVEATKDEPRGFAISTEKMRELIGDPKKYPKILYLWKWAMKLVRGHDIVYEHKTKSYRSLTTSSQTIDKQRKLSEQAERRHKKEMVSLGLIRIDDLPTDHAKFMRAVAMMQHAEVAGKLNAQRVQVQRALTQPDSIPSIAQAIMTSGAFGLGDVSLPNVQAAIETNNGAGQNTQKG